MAGGDRSKALKMLEDPDALMANPEVAKIIAEGVGDTSLEVVEGQCSEGDAPAAAAAASGAAAAGGGGADGAAKAKGGRRTGSSSAGGAGEKEEVVEKEATDEDPREHLNIVFIGHGMIHHTLDEF